MPVESSPRPWWRIQPSPELACVVLIVLYVSAIFIVPPAVDVYVNAVEWGGEEPRVEAGAQPDPDPQYRMQSR